MLDEYSPFEYLLIDIGNHAGKDKLLYRERIAWVDENMDILESLVDQTDKPELYLAAVLALRAVQRGEETGHLVGFDAAASGPAIMATLTGCYTSAVSTGLIGRKRGDLYTTTTKVASQILGSEIKIERQPIKEALMPWCYGSEAKPKEILGDGTPEYNAFFQAMIKVMPGVVELRNKLVNTWNSFALAHSWDMADGYHVYCPVMVPKDSKIKIQELGKEISITYRHEINCGTEKGLSNAANVVHSVDGMVCREMCRRCNYSVETLTKAEQSINTVISFSDADPEPTHDTELLWYNSGFLSLVGVEDLTDLQTTETYSRKYLIALLHLIERTLERDSFPMLTIHDEFKCHALYVQTMRQTYVEIMAEIAESNILSHILSQITDKPVQIEKYTDDLAEHIREGEYSIC